MTEPSEFYCISFHTQEGKIVGYRFTYPELWIAQEVAEELFQTWNRKIVEGKEGYFAVKGMFVMAAPKTRVLSYYDSAHWATFPPNNPDSK